MSLKHVLFIDSFAGSFFNFLINFILLKLVGDEVVVTYGLAMTYSLVITSFLRMILFQPFNVLYINVDGALNEFFFAFITYFFAALFILILFYFISPGFLSFYLLLTVFSYIAIHEFYRLALIGLGLPYLILFSPFIICFYLLLSVVNSLFDFDTFLFLMAVCSAFELFCFMVVSFFKAGGMNVYNLSLDTFLDRYFDFYNLKSRLLSSLLQLSIVHLPFVFISFFLASNLASSVFIFRSLFQPVQIVIKTLDTLKSKMISGAKDKKKFVGDNIRVFILSSLLIGLLCFFSGFLILYNFFDYEIDFYLISSLICWFFVFVFMSLIRPVEFFQVYLSRYRGMNFSYFLALIVLLMSLGFIYFFDCYKFISFAIMLSWFSLAIFQLNWLRFVKC
ncbi:hypothetical protein K8B83_10095 [Shewanella inventionis]|uniref:hypothetical protein n=1 Tax=Shewanella inventionis TaxID=1738770 RepID=UPI001CC18C9E|nr:hypothetical protein [Shewanella inventionis]UAL45124.1 hypothetical protein K8B83_10095 [Shewanella inventionis]